jgi:hypothetical protein
MAAEDGSRIKKCCRRPDITEFDGNYACISCGVTSNSSSHAPSQHAKSLDLAISQSDNNNLFLEKTFYSYSLLQEDEVRLLEVAPGVLSDPLVCEIFHTNLDGVAFEAISYTWADEKGDLTSNRFVAVETSKAIGKRYVMVTANCETAIRCVRSTTETRVIWIDALCINQADLAERGHQVRHMPRIYSPARRVLAYLGNSDQTSDTYLKALILTIPVNH